MFTSQIVDYETAKLLSENNRADVAVFSARSGDFWHFSDPIWIDYGEEKLNRDVIAKYGTGGIDKEFIFIVLLLVPNHG